MGQGWGSVGTNCPNCARDGLSTIVMSARCLPTFCQRYKYFHEKQNLYLFFSIGDKHDYVCENWGGDQMRMSTGWSALMMKCLNMFDFVS